VLPEAPIIEIHLPSPPSQAHVSEILRAMHTSKLRKGHCTSVLATGEQCSHSIKVVLLTFPTSHPVGRG